MHSLHRTWLALLRLVFLFVAICLLFAQLELSVHSLRDLTIGLPKPYLGIDPTPPATELPFLGINIEYADLTASDQRELFHEIAATGIGWVRLRVPWDQVEPAQGEFDWRILDQTLHELAAAQLIPVVVLDGSPKWARAAKDVESPDGNLAPPHNPAFFVHFAGEVAKRYADQLQYYQIWDEPNISPHWGERQIEAVNYARLLKAASIEIRRQDTDATILLAALAPTADRGDLAQDELYFLNRVYAAGAAPYFDAVAIQPFGFASTPDDSEAQLDRLNFQRARLVRQAMLDAGDGETPIWLVRYGWNRAGGSTWGSVSAENQHAFTQRALEIAYHQWPWVVAMGWPAATEPLSSTLSGFSLAPELKATFQNAAGRLLTQPRPQRSPVPPLSWWIPTLLWLLAIAAVMWRGVAMASTLPWRSVAEKWNVRPLWQQATCWAILLLVYYFAVWPPIILLCALVAALGFLAQPRLGLAFALLLLPVYEYHKEVAWLGRMWSVPPTQAMLICLLPALLSYRPKRFSWDRWYAIALGWLAVMLLSATGVWYWPAYWVGMLNLVIAPLLLFLLIRLWVVTRRQGQDLVVALATGGIIIAIVGLIDWIQGGGTPVDGMRRLTGLGYSSNHTALYVVRTLAISVGLMLSSGGLGRWIWAIACALSTLALFLTGSRGAILLGIPAASLFLLSRQKMRLPSRLGTALLLLGAAAGLAVVAYLLRTRIGNFGTMLARMDGWTVALKLWYEHLLFGVGPDGFWWSFPSMLWLTSNADPNLRHPHLLWLEFLTSGGVLAMAWFLCVLVLLSRWIWQKRRRLSWLQVGLVMGLIAAVAHAQVDTFQALAELAGWNWAALALLLALDEAAS